METQSQLLNLARTSIKNSLTAKELVKLFKDSGFKKNSRGKPWTVGAAYQYQVKARKELAKGAEIVDVSSTAKSYELDPQLKLIEAIMDADLSSFERSAMLLKVVRGATELSHCTIESDEDAVHISFLNFETKILTEVSLTHAQAKALLGCFGNLQDSLDGYPQD